MCKLLLLLLLWLLGFGAAVQLCCRVMVVLPHVIPAAETKSGTGSDTARNNVNIGCSG
jgi:hypothetical protein